MIIYAGPTLSPTSRQLIDRQKHHLHAPVKRGDIARLIRTDVPGAILIVDGYFHQSLSVGHEEIRDALDRGWKVTGLGSIGAIRAYELRDIGMLGFGSVHERFISGEDFQDDEVALHHLPAPNYQPISEPLVHFRACLETLSAEGTVTGIQAKEIIDFMKNRYFGERTMDLFCEKFRLVTGISFGELVSNFAVFQIKQQDLVDFLNQQNLWQREIQV